MLKRQLLILDYVLIILFFALLGLAKKDAVVIGAFVAILLYLFITDRKGAYAHLGVASFIALIWMLAAKSQYGYNAQTMSIFGLNAFALFAWATGLFVTYNIYAHWEHLAKSPLRKFILYIVIFWSLLLSAETIAYHFFDIKNVATAVYPGLSFCDCIHAPRWMQASYLLLGPIYYLACSMLGLENPHKQSSRSRK
jgi:hypothetical protein